MAFTIQATCGQERGAFTVAGSGTATGAVDIVVDTAKFTSTMFPSNAGQNAELIRILEEAVALLREGGWPLA